MLLRAVERTRFVGDVELFPRAALEAVRELVPCPVASFNEVDPTTGRLVAVVDPPDYPVPERYHEAFERHAGEHPLIRHLQETGDGSAVKLSDFLSRSAFHRSALYREVYAPLDVEYQISISLPAALPRIIAIACSRKEADFDERERALLNALRPHLAQSYQLAEERERLRSTVGALASALRENDTHVLALDGEPRELTPGAAALLYRYLGQPEDGALPARVSRWLEAERQPYGGRSESPPPLLSPLVAHRGPSTLVVRYLPGREGAGTILLHERPRPLATAELRLLGLTGREAQVLRHLAEGASDREIAGRMQIATGTVRKHLDNIFRKLGVTSRARAVATVLALLPNAAETAPDVDGP